MSSLTPIEKHGAIFVKRDDQYAIAGVNGGKVRSCWELAQGATGLVTAGSRSSPQINIVAQIANKLQIPCRAHTPLGRLSNELLIAKQAGAEIIQHSAGYNNVIIKRALDDSKATGYTNIPFGMECQEAVNQTMQQVENIPTKVKRIVMPVGSGMSLSGVLHGLIKYKKKIPVLGIVVGADPVKRLDTYAPPNWRNMCTLVKSELEYKQSPAVINLGDIILDPIYEAKCLQFLQPRDLFWIVGIRQSIQEEIKQLESV